MLATALLADRMDQIIHHLSRIADALEGAIPPPADPDTARKTIQGLTEDDFMTATNEETWLHEEEENQKYLPDPNLRPFNLE